MSRATALAPIREALAREQPVLIVLAGPNGSGKTTFFTEYLGDLGLPYVNPDLFAAMRREADPGASSEEVERRAFSEAEDTRDGLLRAGISFCAETVFSDPYRAKVGFLERARASGYAVFLVFIGLDSVDLSIARVSHRVATGGHDVPDEKLRARFPRTLANLRAAMAIADEVFLFDNSSFQRPYRLVAVYSHGRLVSQNPPRPPWTHGLPGS